MTWKYIYFFIIENFKSSHSLKNAEILMIYHDKKIKVYYKLPILHFLPIYRQVSDFQWYNLRVFLTFDGLIWVINALLTNNILYF